jgi:osmotically-inducible protein OsmY
MAPKKLFFRALFLSGVFVINIPGASLAQSADNTGSNKGDQSQTDLTAEQQGESQEDIQITKKIRQAIVSDTSLSMYGHNVKIITSGGMVTLKGPASSEEEIKAIIEIAAGIVEKAKITNKMEVAPQ